MVVGLRGATYEEKCTEIGILPLEVRRRHADLIQVYKIVNGLDRISETELFQRVSDTIGMATRQRADNLNLKVPKSKLEVRRNSFACRVVKEWNALDSDIKRKATVHQFKTALKLIYRRSVEDAAAE